MYYKSICRIFNFGNYTLLLSIILHNSKGYPLFYRTKNSEDHFVTCRCTCILFIFASFYIPIRNTRRHGWLHIYIPGFPCVEARSLDTGGRAVKVEAKAQGAAPAKSCCDVRSLEALHHSYTPSFCFPRCFFPCLSVCLCLSVLYICLYLLVPAYIYVYFLSCLFSCCLSAFALFFLFCFVFCFVSVDVFMCLSYLRLCF